MKYNQTTHKEVYREYSSNFTYAFIEVRVSGARHNHVYYPAGEPDNITVFDGVNRFFVMRIM